MLSVPVSAAVVVTTAGKVYSGDAVFSKGAWQIAGQRVATRDVAELRLDVQAVPLDQVGSVTFLDGTVLTGQVTTRSGVNEVVLARSDQELVFAGDQVLQITLGTLASDAAVADLPSAPYTIMRDGRVVPGEIQYLNPFQAGVETAAGRLRLDRDTIHRLVLRDGTPTPGAHVVRTNIGDVIPGTIAAINGDAVTVKRTQGGELQVALDSLLSASVGSVDLVGEAPAQVSTQAFFSEVHAPVFGAGLFGIGNCAGLPCDRGIGVHSRTEISYAVGGGVLVTTIGMDQTLTKGGHAEFVVLMDGVELTRVPLRGDDQATSIAVPVSAGTVTMLFDYGEHGSAGDHGMWAWPVVVR